MITVEHVNALLSWCDVFKYTLKEFVENIKLPQVAIVDIGYYGDTEETRVERNEIITMHGIQTYDRVVGEDSYGKAITISMDCPVKVLVIPLPMICPYELVVTDQIQFVQPLIKYFRVCNPFESEQGDDIHEDTILELKLINSKKQWIQFENVKTKQKVKVVSGNNVRFEPLLDPVQYTLREVKKKFGLPAIVRFLKENPSKKQSTRLTRLVKHLGRVNLLHEIMPSIEVIATTVAASEGATISYLQLPKETCLQLRVSNEYLLGQACYDGLVRKLHEQFNPSKVKEENVDVYEYLEETNQQKKKLTQCSIIEPAVSQDATEYTPEIPKRNLTMLCKPPSRPPKPKIGDKKDHLKRARSTAKKGTQKLNIKSTGSPPSTNQTTDPLTRSNQDGGEILPPSNQDSFKQSLSCKQGGTLSLSSHNASNILSPTTSTKITSRPTESENSDDLYIWPERAETEVHEQGYTYMGNKETMVQHELYETVDYYDDVRPEVARVKSTREKYRNRLPPSLPSIITTETKCDINADTKLCHIPNDLSKLTVEGVGQVLEDLKMESYVMTFRKELIDGEMLMSLDDQAMLALQMNNFHIKKLTKVIEGWRPSFNIE